MTLIDFLALVWAVVAAIATAAALIDHAAHADDTPNPEIDHARARINARRRQRP